MPSGAAPSTVPRAIADDFLSPVQPGETAYSLDLTAAQLKIVHTALKGLLDDLGHDEADVRGVVASVLAKLPDEHSIRAIDLDRELAPGDDAG